MEDPNLDAILAYYRRISRKCKIPQFDVAESIRVGIARTLNYIVLLPPIIPEGVAKIDMLPEGYKITEELIDCWKLARRHVYYRTPKKKPRKNLNQHALNHIKSKIGNYEWIDAKHIRELRHQIESSTDIDDPKTWAWILFKYITNERVISNNKPTGNPHCVIWSQSYEFYDEIWRYADENKSRFT